MNFKNYSQVLSYLQAFYLLVLSRTKALNKLTFHMLHHIIITININVHGGLSNVVRKLVNRFLIVGECENLVQNAKRSGYATGHKPRRYAVMQSTAGYYGHVAIVERVNRNGSIVISEYNYNRPLAYGTRTISKGSARHYNYIY